MAEIELPERWVGVAEPLRALMAELERQGHADRTTPADLVAVSAQWAKVHATIRGVVQARIAEAQAARVPMTKR